MSVSGDALDNVLAYFVIMISRINYMLSLFCPQSF